MLRKSILVVASIALAGVLSCHRTTEAGAGLVLQSEITPRPVRVGRANLVLRLSDALAKPVSGAMITAEADMAHPGMAPVFYPIRETRSGTYQGDIEFSMPGDWVVLVHATLANGAKVEREIRVPGVAAL